MVQKYSYISAQVVPTDPQIESHFVNAVGFYAMWRESGSRYFSYTPPTTDGESNAALTIVVRLDDDVLLGGRIIVNLLAALSSRLASEGPIPAAELQSIGETIALPAKPVRGPKPVAVDGGSGCCYRTYISKNDLSLIFSFPDQAAYEPYACVVVVSATVSAMPENALPSIGIPVVQALTAVCPEGVTAEPTKVELADKITLTYHREGFDPVVETFDVGTTNRFIRVVGPALLVNDAAHAGIVFRRSIPYTAVNSDGETMKSFTILVNGRTANRTTDTFEVTSADFNVDGVVVISVASTNYKTCEQTFTPQQLAEVGTMKFVLVPNRSNVLLRLDFGGGRIIEYPLELEKKDREYNELRAGRFHGFRVHRVVGQDSETYNVDLTAPAAGIELTPAPAPTPVSTPKVAPVVAPVVEVADEEPADKNINFEASDTETTGPDSGEKKGAWIKWIAGILILVAAAVLIWFGKEFFVSSPNTNAADIDVEIPAETEQVDETPQPEVVTTEPTPTETSDSALTEDEAADLKYLNENTVWRRADLRSDRFKELYDLIGSADIDAIASAPYFAKEGMSTNAKAIGVVDMIWASKGTGTQRSNERTLARLKGAAKIDLKELYEQLAKYKDKEPNTEPRPKR